MGAFGYLLLERLDNRVHTPDEVAAVLDLPTFAVIPDFRALTASSAYGYGYGPAEGAVEKVNGNGHAMIPVLHPRSLVSEAYRSSYFSNPRNAATDVMLATARASDSSSE